MKVAYCSVLLLCAIACGPDQAREIARFEEVCGEPGPFRLLELDDDERLRPGSRKIDDRFYFVVGPADGTSTRVVATGLCGESPVEIARDVSVVFERDRWPGRVLGCTAEPNSSMVVLDPSGVDPARVVSPAPACRGNETDLGIVGVVDNADTTRSLALAPHPSDLAAPAVPPVVLAASIRGEPFFPDYLVRGAAAAYTVTPTHDLLRIDLATTTSVVEQPGVAEWGVSMDDRTLAWRDVAEHGDGDPWSVGSVMLRDRVDGREIAFDDVQLQSIPIGTLDADRLFLTLRGDTTITRLVELPSLSVRDFPGEHRFMWEVFDGRLLMKSSFDGPYYLLDPVTGEETRLSELRSAVMQSGTDSFEIFVGSSLEGDNESELWRVPYDGSGDIKLARRVIVDFQLDLDGRIVTPLDLDDDLLGDLVTVDPESLHEELVDDRVVASLGPQGKTFGLHPREIVYGVVDDERSGVWIARLAP